MTPTTHFRVLVLEDEFMLRASMHTGIMRGDYPFPVECMSVGTLGEARRVLSDEVIHLVIADLNLPDGSSAFLMTDVPTVFVTAYRNRYQNIVRERKIFDKPLALNDLRGIVRDAIDAHMLRGPVADTVADTSRHDAPRADAQSALADLVEMIRTEGFDGATPAIALVQLLRHHAAEQIRLLARINAWRDIALKRTESLVSCQRRLVAMAREIPEE